MILNWLGFFFPRLFALDLFCCKINDYISESGAISCSNVRCVFFSASRVFLGYVLPLYVHYSFVLIPERRNRCASNLQRLATVDDPRPIPIAKDVEAYSNAIVEEKIIMFMQWKRNETEICWPIEDVEHHDNKRKNILWQFKWLCPPLQTPGRPNKNVRRSSELLKNYRSNNVIWQLGNPIRKTIKLSSPRFDNWWIIWLLKNIFMIIRKKECEEEITKWGSVV